MSEYAGDRMGWGWVVLALSLCAVASEATAEELTPEAVVEQARQNSPELRAAMRESKRTTVVVAQRRAFFVPQLTADGGYRSGQSPQPGPMGTTFISTQAVTTNLALNHQLMLGTQLSLSASFDRSVRDSVIFGNLGVNVGTGVTLGVTQPLLRGFGRDIGGLQIEEAEAGVTIAELEQAQTANTVMRDALIAYWQLWFAQRQVEIEQQALEVTQRRLEDAEAQVALGALPEAELITLRTEVASAEEALVTSRAQVRRRVADVAGQLGRGMDEELRASPAVVPEVVEPPARQAAMDVAMERSLQLATFDARIDQAQLQVRGARDAAKPNIEGVATLNVNGLGEDVGESFRQLGRLEAVVGFVGVRADLPLSNREEELAAQAAVIARERLADDREAAARTLGVQVAQLHSDWSAAVARLTLARRTATLSEQSVQVISDRFELGRATSLEVVQALQRQREAKLRVASALLDVVVAEVSLKAVMNTLVEDARFR